MSNCLKKIKVSAGKQNLEFPIEMYNTLPGSLVICCLMFTPFEKRPVTKEIIKTWKKLWRHPENYPSFKDEQFIDKTLKLFNLERPENFPIAMVQSQINTLFAPYINNEILPLREDGFKGITLLSGKIYPIDFNNTEEK